MQSVTKSANSFSSSREMNIFNILFAGKHKEMGTRLFTRTYAKSCNFDLSFFKQI